MNNLTVMEESPPNTAEELDLPDLSNMQVLMLHSDNYLPGCWQLMYQYHTIGGRGGRGGGGREGGGGWSALHHTIPDIWFLRSTPGTVGPSGAQTLD